MMYGVTIPEPETSRHRLSMTQIAPRPKALRLSYLTVGYNLLEGALSLLP